MYISCGESVRALFAGSVSFFFFFAAGGIFIKAFLMSNLHIFAAGRVACRHSEAAKWHVKHSKAGGKLAWKLGCRKWKGPLHSKEKCKLFSAVGDGRLSLAPPLMFCSSSLLRHGSDFGQDKVSSGNTNSHAARTTAATWKMHTSPSHPSTEVFFFVWIFS